MGWKAIGNRIIVRKIHEENVTSSGLIISETLTNTLESVAKAEVVSVGSGKNADGSVEPISVEVGDIILYHRHYGTDLSGTVPTADDKDLMALTMEDVLAIVPG